MYCRYLIGNLISLTWMVPIAGALAISTSFGKQRQFVQRFFMHFIDPFISLWFSWNKRDYETKQHIFQDQIYIRTVYKTYLFTESEAHSGRICSYFCGKTFNENEGKENDGSVILIVHNIIFSCEKYFNQNLDLIQI